jgi:ubiquinone/menaquinone biosynthesis C-methylase UbiE
MPPESNPAYAGSMEFQVGLEHYDFESYTSKARWSSYWHQAREVLAVSPASCLVIGAGDGIVPAVLERLGVTVTTADYDERLDPDVVADIRAVPLPEASFDVVLASQVLEHLPLAELPACLSEIRRLTRNVAVISIPQRGRAWELAFRLPAMPRFAAGGVLPARTRHAFNGHHYWELGARGFRRRQFEAILRRAFPSFSTFVVTDNPYQRFYVAKR